MGTTALGVAVGTVLALAGPASLRSPITAVMLAVAYLFLWLPAVRDAYVGARGASLPLVAGEKIWYVVLMLATVGPMALPLLWQSPRFSPRTKLLVSLLVVAIALAGIALTLWLGPLLQRQLTELLELTQSS